MLCNSIKELKGDFKGYLCEIKQDGTRAMLHIQAENKLINRNNKDIIRRYPELKSIKVSLKRCVLDGELVILTNGKSDFSALLSREQTQDLFKIKLMSRKFPIVFIAFDIVVFNGTDVSQFPLVKRKEYLEVFKRFETENFKVIETYELDRALELMKERNEEGIILKKKDSKYYFGVRSPFWLKFKRRIEKVIKFNAYEENPDNSITLTDGFNRVKASLEAKTLIDKFGFVTAEVEGLEINESGLLRMPIVKRLI